MTRRIVDVLVPVALDQPYSYRVPAGLAVAPGDVVRVPLGAREATGAVWAEGVMRPGLDNRLKDIEDKVDVPALRPDMSLTYAAEVMEPLGVRELPVVEHGMLFGILAERDLRPHLGHHEWTAVRTAMTPDPIVVSPNTPVSAVARLLVRHGFNGVPVVHDGKLLGMVARVDLLRLLAGESGT